MRLNASNVHPNGDTSSRNERRKNLTGLDNGVVVSSGKVKGKSRGSPTHDPNGTLLLKAYYTSSILCSVLAIAFMAISFSTPSWEKIYFEKDKVVQAASVDHDNEVSFPNDSEASGSDGYFTVTNVAWWSQATVATTPAGSANQSSVSNDAAGGQVVVNGTTIPARLHVPFTMMGGIWSTCDTLSGKSPMIDDPVKHYHIPV